jgi:hypothetical protein
MSGILSVAREFYGLYSGGVPARDVFRFSALLAFLNLSPYCFEYRPLGLKNNAPNFPNPAT